MAVLEHAGKGLDLFDVLARVEQLEVEAAERKREGRAP
jgi:hypothetical protein